MNKPNQNKYNSNYKSKNELNTNSSSNTDTNKNTENNQINLRPSDSLSLSKTHQTNTNKSTSFPMQTLNSRTSVSQQVFMKTLSLEDFTAEGAQRVKDFICSLCKGIYNNPVFDECGHTFCKECIEASMKIIDFCPASHKPYSKKTFEKAVLFENLIFKQKVFCKNKNLGCAWADRLSARELHLAAECEKRIVLCSACKENDKEFRGFPAQVKDHEENFCDFANVECEKKCGFFFLRIEKNLHAKNCPKEFINCPLRCSAEILREDVEKHLELECPLKVVSCGFKAIGCEAAFERKEEQVHLEQNTYKHTKSLIFYLKDFEEKFFHNNKNESESKSKEKNQKNNEDDFGFASLKEIAENVQEKEKRIDARIEIVLKHLEEKRIKEEQLRKEKEELEKELVNARGLEDVEIKQEVAEEICKENETSFKQGNNNYFNWDGINNNKSDFCNFQKEDEVMKLACIDSNQDGINLSSNNNNNNKAFTLNSILNDDNQNQNQENILKTINSTSTQEKENKQSENSENYYDNNINNSKNNNSIKTSIFKNKKNFDAKKENSENASSLNNSINSNNLENSKQSETPLIKRKRGRPSLIAIREAENLSKVKSEAFPHKKNSTSKTLISQQAFLMEENPNNNSLNSSLNKSNFRNNKENENLTNNEDSKSNLNSSEFSFNPVKGRKLDVSTDSRGQAENLNLSLNSDKQLKSYLNTNKAQAYASNNSKSINNNNNIINPSIDFSRSSFIKNSSNKKDEKSQISQRNLVNVNLANKTDYKKEILERNINEMLKKDMHETRKINAGDLFSRNIKCFNSHKHASIASIGFSGKLNDFSEKSKAFGLEMNNPQQQKKLEIVLSDEETEKYAQAQAQYINVTKDDLDQILFDNQAGNNNNKIKSDIRINNNKLNSNLIISCSSNQNNSEYNTINNKSKNPSIEKIKNALKKRENEKKIIDDFLQNYSTNFSNKETLIDSENSNFISSNTNQNSNSNSNSSSGQKAELKAISQNSEPCLEKTKAQKTLEEIEERDRKLNFSREESDFQMVSPQANKTVKVNRILRQSNNDDAINNFGLSQQQNFVDLNDKIIENNFVAANKEEVNMLIDSDEGCEVHFSAFANNAYDKSNYNVDFNYDADGFKNEKKSYCDSSSGFYNINNNNAEFSVDSQAESPFKNLNSSVYLINENSQKETINFNDNKTKEAEKEAADKMDLEFIYFNESNQNFKNENTDLINTDNQAEKLESMEVEINADSHKSQSKSQTLEAPTAQKANNTPAAAENDILEIQITSVNKNPTKRKEIKISSSSSQSSSAAKNSFLRSKENSAKKSERSKKAAKLLQQTVIDLRNSEAASCNSAQKDFEALVENQNKVFVNNLGESNDNNCLSLEAKVEKEEVSIEIDSEENFKIVEKITCNNNNNNNEGEEENIIMQAAETERKNNNNEKNQVESKANSETKEIIGNNIRFNNNNNFIYDLNSDSSKSDNQNIQSITNLICGNNNQENEIFNTEIQSLFTASEQEKDQQQNNENSKANTNLKQFSSEIKHNNNTTNFSSDTPKKSNLNNSNKISSNSNNTNNNNIYLNNNINNPFSSFSPNTKTSNFSDTESKNSNFTNTSKNSSLMQNPNLNSSRNFASFYNLENNTLDESSQESETLFVFDKANTPQNFSMLSETKISLTQKNFNNANSNNSNNQTCSEALIAMIDFPLKNPKKTYKWRVKVLKLTGWLALGICYKETIIANNFKFVYEKKNLLKNHGTFIFSLNGYRWNTSVKNEDYQKNSNFPKITVEDNNDCEIILEYFPAMKMLLFNYGKYQAKLKYVNVEQGKTILPCVVMESEWTEVEIEKILE